MKISKNKVSPARSENMRAIRSFGNRTTELRLRAILVQRSISGWKLHDKCIFGVPDFFFPKEHVAVFVDGCFWHGCPRCGHLPKTNTQYWLPKLRRIGKRDLNVSKKLRQSGCRVVRIWECSVRLSPGRCVRRICRALRRSVT